MKVTLTFRPIIVIYHEAKQQANGGTDRPTHLLNVENDELNQLLVRCQCPERVPPICATTAHAGQSQRQSAT